MAFMIINYIISLFYRIAVFEKNVYQVHTLEKVKTSLSLSLNIFINTTIVY